MATKKVKLSNLLELAIDIRDEQREIAQKGRELQSRLKELDIRFCEIEKFISENPTIYYCETCRKWFNKNGMRRIDDNKPIGSGNKCVGCCEEQYFKQLAKSSINQSGISLYDIPEELIEMETIRAKTRFILKTKTA